MANIENRRIKRRLTGVAAIVGALLVLAALILGIVLLSKGCAKRRAGENEQDEAAFTAAPTDPGKSPEPTGEPPQLTEEPQTTDGARPSASPTEAAPAASASEIPSQTTEDRSLMNIVMSVGSYSGADGEHLKLIGGSCTMAFVNNTDTLMYGAYIGLGGLTVSRAWIDGAAVRFSNEEAGVCLLPFADVLAPGESAELYFEFSGSVSADVPMPLPYPAYDTVYDVVCTVTSDSRLGFSSGAAEQEQNGSRTVYFLRAQGVRSLEIGFSGAEEQT